MSKIGGAELPPVAGLAPNNTSASTTSILAVCFFNLAEATKLTSWHIYDKYPSFVRSRSRGEAKVPRGEREHVDSVGIVDGTSP